MSNQTKKSSKPATGKAKPETKAMQRVHPDSRSNKIANLEVGESYAEAHRINPEDVAMEVIEVRTTNLRSTMGKAAARANERTGNSYTTELGGYVTNGKAYIVCATVTRVA